MNRRTSINRREFLAAGGALVGTTAATGILTRRVWPQLATEDLLPGAAPDITLTPNAWTETADQVSFVAVGDNGSGGRNALAVASQMAYTYDRTPFGLVALLGDICYYGDIKDRYDIVFERPLRPLIDAGVRFELAIGNHEDHLDFQGADKDEVAGRLQELGTPDRYFTSSHGPVDFFVVDSSDDGISGSRAAEQREFLEDALASSTSQWKIVTMHHPPYSSGTHGSALETHEWLVPMFGRHGVDLVLSGHDHHYERTRTREGVTYVISGGGCKPEAVDPKPFTVAAEQTLQFLHVDVVDDHLTGLSLRPDASVVDRFVLRPRAT